MKARLLLFLLIFILHFPGASRQLPVVISHPDVVVENPYAAFFDEAYAQYPEIPRGLLEAVAFTNTRFHHVTHTDGEEESCIGMPKAYGVMGLTLDGKNYFKNNLRTIAGISGYSVNEIVNDPEKNILAFARAYSMLFHERTGSVTKTQLMSMPASVLIDLSELPNETEGQQFAVQAQLYGIFSFMNDPKCQQLYNFPDPHFDLQNFFGANYKILSASSVTISAGKINDGNGNVYRSGNDNSEVQSSDYGPAIWNAAASCNYSSRNGTLISAVTIHDTEGSYAGSISWFQNCAASVSAHYVVRSSDGQITQMVLESNKAWHVGTENGYTIGIEHEGYQSQTGWYTNAMYTASAALVADICASGYGIDPLRTAWWPWVATTYYNQSSMPGGCTKIKGHQHYPNQTHTDPGPNWDWNYFYMLINTPPAATMLTTASGTFYDTGGAAGNYSDDERTIWTIAPTAATNVTLTFNNFSVENNWDYVFIYDGPNVNAPLIGEYTGTNSPGTIVSSGGSLTVEFRSDCATNAPGWDASWTSNTTTNVPANLSVASTGCPNLGVTLNWTNSGAGWYVDISTDPGFSTYYNKDVSNLTSVGCPGGFCLYPSCASYLKFAPNTTYYWRIWDGVSHTYGASFTTPDCQYADYNCSGTFDDTGGPSSAYSGNEDYTYMIMPTNASSVTMTFTSFDLETNFDSLYVFDGPNTSAPLLGTFTGTNSPGTISSTGGAITLRFISDPFVNNAGFTSTWNCTQVTTGMAENANENSLSAFPNPFNGDLHVSFTLEQSAIVQLSLTDVFGKEIFVNEETQSAGTHTKVIDGKELPAGIYFLRMTADGKTSVVKVLKN